ncbi:MAG: hypothetical protein M3Q71_12785 [Chloroflexota bacterium]|nr:hypothetical protein [Chloroflexota bacterium]
MRAPAWLIVVAVLGGCASGPVQGDSRPGAATSAGQLPAVPGEEDNPLVPARYPDCDRGEQFLRYLATGDNGGVPDLDQLFAEYVSVPEPQARALASDWIEACNAQYAEQEAAESSAQAEADASAAADASQAAEASAEAGRAAEVRATMERSCAAVGGEVAERAMFGVGCHSTVQGNPSGQLGGGHLYDL